MYTCNILKSQNIAIIATINCYRYREITIISACMCTESVNVILTSQCYVTPRSKITDNVYDNMQIESVDLFFQLLALMFGLLVHDSILYVWD